MKKNKKEIIREIIVDCGKEEIRVALLEDKQLVEIYFERINSRSLVGNIYKGKVSSVLPGMQAAFIDIGCDRNAFLYVADAIAQKEYHDIEEEVTPEIKDQKIENILKEGQELTVQVIKDSMKTKGPRVTTNISLAGRHIVLAPGSEFVGVSRRIEDEDEKTKLRQIAEKIKPKDMGIIMRTVSEGKKEEDFKFEIDFLVKLWKAIKKKEKKGSVPRCIYKDENLLYRTVRDLFTANVEKLIINSAEEYENIMEFLKMAVPSLKLKVELYFKDDDIFDYYEIENNILKAIERKVRLKCGGYLIIDPTEALTVIDVNTGKYTGDSNLEDTVLKTNLEAATEIAKQIRLRDIGGIVIIDFIDMQKQENRQAVIDALDLELKKDRTKTSLIGMTGLGLIEMTRKKIRIGLSSVICETCPKCKGTGRILCNKEES